MKQSVNSFIPTHSPAATRFLSHPARQYNRRLMGPLSAQVEMDAPRERVFDFLVDLANRPVFTDHFLTNFHLARIESSGEGASARFCMEGRGPDAWFDTQITETDFPHRIT